jgi:hypothetical protein
MLRMKHDSKRGQSTGGRKGLPIYTPLVNITVITSRWRDWENKELIQYFCRELGRIMCFRELECGLYPGKRSMAEFVEY